MTDVMDFFNDDEMCELLMADNHRDEDALIGDEA